MKTLSLYADNIDIPNIPNIFGCTRLYKLKNQFYQTIWSSPSCQIDLNTGWVDLPKLEFRLGCSSYDDIVVNELKGEEIYVYFHSTFADTFIYFETNKIVSIAAKAYPPPGIKAR